MTKQMKQHIDCPLCGASIPMQDDFHAWINTEVELDSCRIGITVADVDLIIHRFKFDNNRDYQCIMLVEKKIHGKEPEPWQTDTLNIFGQFLRNDKKTPFKGRRAQVENRPCKAYSTMNRKVIVVKAFGYHLLQFENTNPNNGWIRWDRKEVTICQLIKILKFELHPETLKPLDGRDHHKQGPLLFKTSTTSVIAD